MHDTDSGNPFEAPKQPTDPTDPSVEDPIRYECTPTVEDLNAALRSVPSISFSLVFMLIMGLLFFAVLANLISGEIAGVPYWASLMVALMLIGVSAQSALSRINAADTHIAFNPHALDRLSGELNKNGLLLRSQHRVSWQSHVGLKFCQTRNRQLILSYDSQGASFRILPVRGFQTPTLATRFLEHQAQNQAEPLDMLQPVTSPSMIGERPTDAIEFSGFLKAGDLKTSPLETIRKRNIKRLAIWMLVLTLIPLPLMAAFAFQWQTIFFVCMSILLVTFLTVYKTILSGGAFPDPEQPLIAIQGWLTQQEIALLHNIGQSRSRWQDFRQFGFNNDCIWLLAHGGKNRFILLQRRFFADDSQWQAALDLVRHQLLQTNRQPGP